MSKVPKTTSTILQYLKENLKDEVDVLSADKRQSFFKLILSYQVCVVRYAQVIQNNKFAITSQYLKKGVNDKIDFHIDGDGQAFPEFPK